MFYVCTEHVLVHLAAAVYCTKTHTRSNWGQTIGQTHKPGRAQSATLHLCYGVILYCLLWQCFVTCLFNFDDYIGAKSENECSVIEQLSLNKVIKKMHVVIFIY